MLRVHFNTIDRTGGTLCLGMSSAKAVEEADEISPYKPDMLVLVKKTEVSCAHLFLVASSISVTHELANRNQQRSLFNSQ